MTQESIELHPAHCWDCPACGRHNFTDCVRAELTDAEHDELLKMMGDSAGEEWKGEEGEQELRAGCELVSSPNEVTCAGCGVKFPVEIPDDLPDDFEPHRDLGGK